MKIGQRIRDIRESRNVTQEYMAAKLRISTTTYGNIERSAVKRLTLAMVLAIARVLNVHYTELLGERLKDNGYPIVEEKSIQVLRQRMQQLLLKMEDIEKQLRHLLSRP